MKRLVISSAFLIAVVGIGGSVYYNATTPYRLLPPVEVSAAQAAAAVKKLDAIQGAAGEAATTGKPTPVSESFTDSELTALATQKLRGRSVHLEQLTVHSAAHGMIEGQANARWRGQTVPLYLVASIQVVNGNEPQLKIVQATAGRMNVPQALTDLAEGFFEQNVSVGRLFSMDQLKITTTDGLLTISGVAKR